MQKGLYLSLDNIARRTTLR